MLSWGNLQAGVDQAGYAFTGREWDPEIGLYYYRARYYDPRTGRFLSDDPARGRGGRNSYAYVGDTPTSYRDPAGLWRVWGNWCGPDWTGGRTEEYNLDHVSSYLSPIDDNDAACMRHDFCYYTCRKGFRCDKANRTRCMRRCDRILASETGSGTSEAGMVSAFAVWIVMRPPRTPDAGTDESCGCPSQPPPPANGDTCYGGLCLANPGAYF
jgi:RHS repeat-associated protein